MRYQENIKIKLIKSTIGCCYKDKITLHYLGLKKIGSYKIFKKNNILLNKIYKIHYLLYINNI